MTPISTSACGMNQQQLQCYRVFPVHVDRTLYPNETHRRLARFSPSRNVVVDRGIGLQCRRRVESGRRVVMMSMRTGEQLEERSKEGVAHEVQTVVIVGAGLAGLATALALHRVGVKALVLEQSGGLRTEGTSLTLFPNAWRALDALGVADQLRGQFINCVGGRMRSSKGKVIKEFLLSDVSGGPHEVRAVERQALLRVLAEALPSDTILFNSRVKKIRKPSDTQSVTEVELDNSTVYRTKVLIGCDGARSVVASWMGRPDPQPVGQIAIRGLSEFPSGHNLAGRVEQIIGHGVRAGLVPVSEKKVYWFVLFKIASSVPPRLSDPSQVKAEALHYMRGWPGDIQECIQQTPLDSFNRSSLRDRWSLPFLTPQQAAQGITLAGDAAHPMTPNLAQGGGTSLEDAVVLTRKLCQALREGREGGEPSGRSREIGAALTDYEKERWARTFRLTVKSFVFGWLLSWDWGPVCFVRDSVALPVVFRASVVLSSSKFDCGALPPPLEYSRTSLSHSSQSP